MNQSIKRHTLSIFVISVFLFLAYGTTETDDTPWHKRDNSIEAYIMTQDWVKDRLVSPSTAEFAGAVQKEEHTTYLGDQKYRIESYVDSENRMGGTMRTHFTAVVEQVEEDEWKLHSLEFHE